LLRLDSDGLFAALIERFRAAGCRRFAAFVAHSTVAMVREECLPLLRAAELETRTEWWHGLPMDPFGAACARSVVHLLCSLPSRQRPDCLLIADDNLVAHVTAGLLDAGIQVPAQLRVAAHANFPHPTHASVPLLRYGPDIEAILRSATAEIDRLASAPGDFALLQVPVEIRGRGA